MSFLSLTVSVFFGRRRFGWQSQQSLTKNDKFVDEPILYNI